MGNVAAAHHQLDLAERPLLGHHFLGHRGHADVLQQADHAQQIKLFARQLQKTSESQHVNRYAESTVQRMPALLLEFGEQHHRVRIAHHAVRHAGHRLLHPWRIERLAGFDVAHDFLEHDLGLALRGTGHRQLFINRGLFTVGHPGLDGGQYTGAQRGRRLRRTAHVTGQQLTAIGKVRPLLEVDINFFAVSLQRFQLLLVAEDKALVHERRFRPWAVQFGDEHAEFEFFYWDFFFHLGIGMPAEMPAPDPRRP